MERILKDSFIFNVYNVLISLYRESFLFKILSILNDIFEKSFIFRVLTSFGFDLSFNFKTGPLSFNLNPRFIITLLIFILIPPLFFIKDIFIKITSLLILYFILYSLLFNFRLVKRSFSFFILSPYLNKKFLFYLIPFYPLIDFFLRKRLSSFSSIWDEGFLIILFLFFFLFIRRKRILFTEIINPVLTFFFFLTLSLSTSNIPLTAGINGIRSYLQMFLFFIILVNIIEDKEDIKRLIYSLIFSTILISIYAIYQFIVKVPIPSSWVDRDLETGITTRAFSIFTSPNALSGYLILVIPLIFILSLNSKGVRRYIYLFITLLSLSALLFTLTRASWLSLFLALFIFSLFYKDKRILLLLIILILSSLFIPQIRIRFMNLLSPIYMEKARTYGRIYRWNLALDIFRRRPIFGVGPGGFGGAVASRIGFFEGIYVDNYYLKTLVETGIFGLSSFLFLIFVMIRRGIATIKKKEGFLKHVALGITFGLISFFMNNITENLWEVVPLSVIMWTEVAILFSIRRIGD